MIPLRVTYENTTSKPSKLSVVDVNVSANVDSYLQRKERKLIWLVLTELFWIPKFIFYVKHFKRTLQRNAVQSEHV